MNVYVKDIRIWSKNPRYTNYSNVSFCDIGKEDFEINELNNEFKDLYFDNLKSNYIQLINNKEKIKSMISLLESLSMGYDPNIDEILITSSPFLKSKKILNNDEDFFYSLEGNRRIFAINILLNSVINQSNGEKIKTRDIILNFCKDKYINYLEKLNNIFYEFDNNNINLKNIEVKEIKIDNMAADDIWKTLNARHFGKRKGKMNWPRGLVLSSINEKMQKFREDFCLSIGDEMQDYHYKKALKNLENFTGKEISNRDLQMALLVTYCIEIYNSQKKSEKIIYSNTNEDGSENDNEEKTTFKISSLELSFSTIKIISKKGIKETLSSIIGLDINTKKWKIKSNLFKEERLEKLIIYIINLIKEGKLNTRYFNNEYENELKEIIYSKKDDEVNNLIEKDINKISPKFAPFSLIMNDKYQDRIDFSGLSEKEKNDFLSKINSIKENILPILDEIIKIEYLIKVNINKIENRHIYAIFYVWMIELNSIIKNKEIISIWNFPIFIFSATLRSSSEMLMLMILEENKFESYFKDKINKNEKKFFKNIFDFENWIESTKEIGSRPEYSIKSIYNYFFSCEKDINQNKSIDFIKIALLKSIENNSNVNLENKEKIEEMSKKINDFISWSLNKEISKKINSFIHCPSLLKNIHFDNENFSKLSNEFNQWINIIIDLIKYLI